MTDRDLLSQIHNALPPDPAEVPQWGVPDYREAVKRIRTAVLVPPAVCDCISCRVEQRVRDAFRELEAQESEGWEG